MPVLTGKETKEISIHALREEGDIKNGLNGGEEAYFNPRPPRGGRPLSKAAASSSAIFQSTPSARRATILLSVVVGEIGISIHALREEGDPHTAPSHVSRGNFNPRPPRGGRPGVISLRPGSKLFQSTPSARRATGRADEGRLVDRISIHALREEGDRRSATSSRSLTHFNPRPPRGGRPCRPALPCCCAWNFNPRPPRGGRRPTVAMIALRR